MYTTYFVTTDFRFLRFRCMDSPEVLQPFFLCEPPEQAHSYSFCWLVAFDIFGLTCDIC